MANRKTIGGVIHRYQKYDPKNFPSPTQPPADLASPAMQHLMMYGNTRRLTEEELARAIRLDASQFSNLGPSIDFLIAMLLERKRKILAKYETATVQKLAHDEVRKNQASPDIPHEFRKPFTRAVADEQIYDLEKLWYRTLDDQSPFARLVVATIKSLGDKYEVDELSAKYDFVGQESLSIEKALEIKQELEKIDELLEQLEKAKESAQIAIIDMDALESFVEDGDLDDLREVQQMIDSYVREMAERQGLDFKAGKFEVTPKAYRIFQSKLLEQIFSNLEESRSGRHSGPVEGEGAVELPISKPYEFGDSVAQMDIPQSFINALIRQKADPGGGIELRTEDIEIHRTRNNPKCATVVIMDMSGSMRYDGQYVNVKRMAFAIDGLIRSEYPGDFLGFIEMYSFAKIRRQGEIGELMPKPVTITDPFVQLSYDLSDENVSEHMIHPHFTNIQHGLQQARQLLAAQDTPNRQIILITDGLPTAHFQQERLYLLYPPNPLTEAATMREGMLCHREGITINLFLIPSWSQSEEDIQFAYRLAETTHGRVFFTAGQDLDRFVVWDYVNRKRSIIG